MPHIPNTAREIDVDDLGPPPARPPATAPEAG